MASCENAELRSKIVEDCLVNRKLIINGDVDSTLSDIITMNILKFNEEDDMAELTAPKSQPFNRADDPIRIYIDSVGGEAPTMFNIISAIESSKTPVYTYAMGKVYSAGFFVFIAGHKRFTQPSTSMMYHQISYGTNGFISEHIDRLQYELKTQQRVDSLVLKYTKIPKKKIEEINRTKTDWFFYGDDDFVIKWKIADSFF